MRKIMICLLLLSGIGWGQPSDDLKIGIALRGGGALGFAHIGSLSVIDSLGIPIDYVAGTSMGGLIGGLYAIGFSATELEEFVMEIDWQDIFDDMPERKYLPYLIKKNSGRYQLSLDLKGITPSLPDGLVAGRKIYNLIFSKTYPYEGIESFDDLPIPFRCIGSDIITSKEIVFSSGSLAKAMRTTMSIPTVFDPVRYGDSLIVDGGILNNFPVDVVKKMGADYVIGLDLIQPRRDVDYYDNLLKILDRTMDVPREAKLLHITDMADLLIEQNIDRFSLADFDKETIPRIIRRGKKAAYENIDQLIALKERLTSGEKKSAKKISGIEVKGNSRISKTQIERILHIGTGNDYREEDLKEQVERFNKASNLTRVEYIVQEDEDDSVLLLIDIWENKNPVPKNIRFVGNKQISDEFLLNFLGLQTGKAIDLPKILHNTTLLYGLGYFKDIRHQIDQNTDKTIDVLFEIKEKSEQKFLFGIHYDDFYKLVGIIGVRFTNLIFPGIYLETDLQFSGLTIFRTDLYYPSRSMDFPVYPILSLGYQSVPRDVYDSTGVRTARYDERGWYFGGGVGLSISKFLNYEGKLLLEYPNIILEIGDPGEKQGEIKDKILAFTSDLNLDLLDNVLIPNEGIKFKAFLELSTKNVGSSYNYVRLATTFDYYNTFSKNHTARFFAMYLRSWHEEPFYKTIFFIGGPKSFVGLNYMQAHGPQFSVLRAEYRWQFLSGLYLTGIVNTALKYELGLPDISTSGKPLWGYGFSFMYSSIMGPIKLYLTWGDKTPYDPGGAKEIRYYFWAGYSL